MHIDLIFFPGSLLELLDHRLCIFQLCYKMFLNYKFILQIAVALYEHHLDIFNPLKFLFADNIHSFKNLKIRPNTFRYSVCKLSQIKNQNYFVMCLCMKM